MFFPEPLREVNLFVHERDLEAVTEAVVRFEGLQLEEVRPEAWQANEAYSRRAARYQALQQRCERLFETLGLAPAGNQEPITARDEQGLEAELALLEGRVFDLVERLERSQREVERLELAAAQLERLLPLDTPIEALQRLRHLHLAIGLMPSANLARVAAALFQIPFVLLDVQRRGEQTLVAAACVVEHGPILDRALHSAFFEPVSFPPQTSGLPAEALAALRRQLALEQHTLAELRDKRRRLVEEVAPQVQALWQQVRTKAIVAEAMQHFPRQEEIYLIAGWVPAARLAELSRVAREAAEQQVVIDVLPLNPERQGVPTLLATPRWLSPFETLVKLFGLPAHNELNPTALTAVTVLFMYGMMFGDLGHGALLALAGWLLTRRGVALGALIIAAGLSAMAFGLLYGSAFGMHPWPALWLQPMYDIFTLLTAAVVAGVVLLNVGFALNLIRSLRAKAWAELFLDKNGVLGILFYWTLLGGGLLVILQGWPSGPWLALVTLFGLGLWLRELLAQRLFGAPKHSLGETLLTGFFEFFEALISYVSNTLSFVRLGAFAVAHEGLSQVVLQYSSGPGGWLVFLLGTLLIVGFEGLIVGIQTLRLEYYEFFGRFFRGTGKPFVPLSLKGGGRAGVGVRM